MSKKRKKVTFISGSGKVFAEYINERTGKIHYFLASTNILKKITLNKKEYFVKISAEGVVTQIIRESFKRKKPFKKSFC